MGGMHRKSLGERMAQAARELQEQNDPQATMDAAVRLAVDNVPGCDVAAISLVHARRRIDTPAYSAKEALIADQLQYETDEGPCLDAVHEDELVHSRRLAQDPRWKSWGPKVEEATGFRSIFCFRLFTHETTVGALNLYSTREGAFDAGDREDGIAIAAHIAVAVAAAREIGSVTVALESRTTIGVALGIVMERYDITQHQAFALLSRLSSHNNVKLRDVAAEIVTTRAVPTT